MIEFERMQQLIKEKAVIYTIKEHGTKPIRLSKGWRVGCSITPNVIKRKLETSMIISRRVNRFVIESYDIKGLFETESEAVAKYLLGAK